jgi:hypothetical protein
MDVEWNTFEGEKTQKGGSESTLVCRNPVSYERIKGIRGAKFARKGARKDNKILGAGDGKVVVRKT